MKSTKNTMTISIFTLIAPKEKPSHAKFESPRSHGSGVIRPLSWVFGAEAPLGSYISFDLFLKGTNFFLFATNFMRNPIKLSKMEFPKQK